MSSLSIFESSFLPVKPQKCNLKKLIPFRTVMRFMVTHYYAHERPDAKMTLHAKVRAIQRDFKRDDERCRLWEESYD